MQERLGTDDDKLHVSAFEEQRSSEYAALRAMSMEQRGRMIAAACKTAAAIQRGRIASGLPAPTPAPWPASTIAFLRRHAADGRE
ncbi:MAG: hypothetical protein O3C40_08560 [Planctomycetota bacterium]|nr:hypothetical protein [Planctomycetota bacterium]